MTEPRHAEPRLADPALVVLVGASASGKSTWAAARYRAAEIDSSDALRGVAGSGPYDLDASADAFALLEQIVDARASRGLTTVVDTLGFDSARRERWLRVTRSAGLPAVAVVFSTDAAECRRRNALRDVPVPAPALAGQLRRAGRIVQELTAEGWDEVVEIEIGLPPAPTSTATEAPAATRTSQGLEVMLQVSRFPWGEDPAGWLADVALAADEAGFAGIALMDHLIQIPQVGRAWEPIPEPFVTIGLLAGLDTRLQLGTLVTPVTMRPAGVTAKAVATLDALSGGRAFVGVGAGWWEREHLAFGLPFAAARERLDLLEAAIETMRALWAPGTKPYAGARVELPETTCYPRPAGHVPIIVGGSGERRTLKIAARLADGCNLPSDPEVLARKVGVLRRHCADAGRDPVDVKVSVLDLPVIGNDRDDVWRRVERLRGRVAASTFAKRHHAGPIDQQRDRYAALAEAGVSTVFLGLPDLAGADDVRLLAPLLK